MKKEDFYWLIWGILVAFSLQVFYDEIGEFPNITQKFLFGFTIDVILLVGLLLYGLLRVKKNQKRTRD